MHITFNIPEFTRNERNSQCDVLHITPVRVARLVLDDAIAAIQTSRYRPIGLQQYHAQIDVLRMSDRCFGLYNIPTTSPSNNKVVLPIIGLNHAISLPIGVIHMPFAVLSQS